MHVSLSRKYGCANRNPRKVFENFKYHDPKSPLLLGPLKPGDIVTPSTQKSFLASAPSARKKEASSSADHPDLF